jgi:TolB-like protein/tetratricopeptide (TPR) repeat protein
LVDRTLAGEGDQVNEYSVGVDVFDKLPSFDPRSDSMVRTDITRLRQRLRQYYAEEGSGDPVVIDLPARSYKVSVAFRDELAAHSAESLETSAEPDPTVDAPDSLAPNQIAQPATRRGVRFWTLVGAVVVTASVLAGVAWSRLGRHAHVIQSLVVLPFQDYSSDHRSEYLADGLTDEITNELANFNGLRVIARTSAFEFKGKGVDVRDVGRQLNVDAALEGSLDREGDRIRIRAQLNRTTDGSHLWSHAYDVQFRDLLAVQRDMARSIAEDLKFNQSLNSDKARASIHDPDPEVHDLVLRGMEAWNAASADSFREGAALFQNAVDRDPKYAGAWASLSGAHWDLGIFTGWKEVTVEQVESESQRAADLDPTIASVRAFLGQLAWRRHLDWARADADFKLALQTGSGSASVHSLYAGCLAERQEFEASHKHFRIAQELSPLSDLIFTNDAGIYLAQLKLGEAERLYKQVLSRKPDFTIALAGMAGVRIAMGDYAGAQPYADRLNLTAAKSGLTAIVNFALLVCNGKTAQARQFLEAAKPAILRVDFAAGQAALGDNDGAIASLRESYDRREIGITRIAIRPEMNRLRGDPRFIELEREIGLKP